jgi:RNA polymerase subunit RPABC4/transcription elongation factor Spt4
MKYCYECGRMTPGDPLYCNFCGRSYDLKLCARHHPNPRIAEICSQCGSRELSTPQPKVPIWWRILEWLTRMFVAALLTVLSVIFIFEFLVAVLQSSAGQGAVILLTVLLGVLWWLWTLLPDWFRKLIKKSFERRRHRDER